MAKVKVELPTEVIKEIEFLSKNSKDIFGKMTKAGAEVAYKNIVNNVPAGMKQSSELMNCLRITKVYTTPSDGGINTKVLFSGYFTNENGVKTPAPLVANIFEYGRSFESKHGGIVKQPFLRRSFNKNQIEKAMLDAQRKESRGLLDE